jgi:hypothetical protein
MKKHMIKEIALLRISSENGLAHFVLCVGDVFVTAAASFTIDVFEIRFVATAAALSLLMSMRFNSSRRGARAAA